MASRILANLIVMGSGILGRAVIQAYRKALERFPDLILGIPENTSWEEVVEKYDNLFENNVKNGSFYLQSKVHRAKECLEAVYQGKDQGQGSG